MGNDSISGRRTRPLHSLRTLFAVLFFLLMIGTVLLGLLLNSVFLESYYMSDRKTSLIRVYQGLQTASVQDLLETEDIDLPLRETLRRSNVSLLVMDSNTRTVKSWSADEPLMEARLYASIFGLTPVMTEGMEQEEIPVEGSEEFQDREFLITDILEEDPSYTINVVLDRNTNTRSMEMWGMLERGSFFLMRSPLEDVRRSAAVANRFFGYISVFLALAGAMIAWWLSKRITEPVRQLTELSQRMKMLDFSAKYENRDRTELDVLGSNMNELSQKLEETISALRTANNDLQRDLDRRNRQEEMRQDFLSNVTHELKTPIALIQGYAEGLQDGIADDPESRDFYLDTILEESERMNTIVQKVLQLNQLEFGDSSVSMERFDIISMIRNYLESASLLAAKEDIRLLFEQEAPLYVWGDPFLIQEVFQNYYSNALHYVQAAPAAAGSRTGTGSADPDAEGRTFSGAGKSAQERAEKVVDIRCDCAGGLVRVTVFNTGLPIPEESLPHIWEKFYKVDKARTRAYGGSGVGLSIVKAIMDLHHHAYGAENYENGVAFWFELDESGKQDPGKPA
ncbi:MAG: HAMP domain-containing sensor histidine kinase [Eubacteriales bacterium]|nr:HAMP domain-containing sensor histidine kinase [Eubacteriales bacterium]